jgi:hypothetical protein
MSELLQNGDLVKILVAVTALITGIISALSIRASLLAIRAKTRASRALRNAAKLDLELQRLVWMASKGQVDDIEAVRKAIEAHIQKLSEQDQQFVYEGLDQSSRVGAKRYATEVLGRA